MIDNLWRYSPPNQSDLLLVPPAISAALGTWYSRYDK
jgi:hypothetical protein